MKINKEIKDYTESIFFGLSMRQCIFAFLACIVAVGIYLLTIDKLGMEITSWLCILGAFPFAALGFITFQSMNAEEIFISALRSFLLTNTNLINKPFNLYYEASKKIIERDKKEALIKDAKKLSKMENDKQGKVQSS